MMNELVDKLHIEQCPLVLLYERDTCVFKGRGVRMLYSLLSDEPKSLFKSKMATKAADKAAAKVMVDDGVTEVYADAIGKETHSRFRDAGMKIDYDKRVNYRRFLEIWKQMGEVKD